MEDGYARRRCLPWESHPCLHHHASQCTKTRRPRTRNQTKSVQKFSFQFFCQLRTNLQNHSVSMLDKYIRAVTSAASSTVLFKIVRDHSTKNILKPKQSIFTDQRTSFPTAKSCTIIIYSVYT